MTTTFKLFCKCILLVVLLLPVSGMAADKKDGPKKPVIAAESQEKADDYDLDPTKWGIQNNCIHTNRIRKMTFVDQQTALITISRKKTILMTLDRRCPGVDRSGVSYESRNGMLCARFDHIVSLDTKISCRIKSFEPYLLPEGDGADDFSSDQ